jgi:hypothetical protein
MNLAIVKQIGGAALLAALSAALIDVLAATAASAATQPAVQIPPNPTTAPPPDMPPAPAGSAIGADADPLAQARLQFQAAYSLARLKLADAPGEDPPVLRDYPLYPYLLAARLRRDLSMPQAAADEALDARAGTWLEQYGDWLPAAEVRRAWLVSLAQRNAWAAFEAHYPDADSDPTLRCDHLVAELKLGRTQDLAAAVARAMAQRSGSPGRLRCTVRMVARATAAGSGTDRTARAPGTDRRQRASGAGLAATAVRRARRAAA